MPHAGTAAMTVAITVAMTAAIEMPRLRPHPGINMFNIAKRLGFLWKGASAMCDYSLEMYASRPAREGEKYVTTRFPTGSLGLAVPGDTKTAVCVQCDTELQLANLSVPIQQAYGVKAAEHVTFVRLDKGAYRDGIRFSNGQEVSLQHLGSGVEVCLAVSHLQRGGPDGRSSRVSEPKPERVLEPA